MQARFPKGTFARIAVVLRAEEDRTEFVHDAVERELRRRERKAGERRAGTVTRSWEAGS